MEEETALARRAFRGDVEAQERLARHNVRFVVSVAKKFQNRGVPLMDLIGEGNVGLMTAARKFDPDRGVKFISYAVWWIRQAIQAAIARHGRPVACLSTERRTSTGWGGTTLLTERLGRAPTTDELVEATGLTRDAVRSLGALHIEAMRLDHPVREADDRGSWSGSSPWRRKAPTQHAGEQQDPGPGSRARGTPGPGRQSAPALFRSDDGKSRTLEEIGRMMGVTRERISSSGTGRSANCGSSAATSSASRRPDPIPTETNAPLEVGASVGAFSLTRCARSGTGRAAWISDT